MTEDLSRGITEDTAEEPQPAGNGLDGAQDTGGAAVSGAEGADSLQGQAGGIPVDRPGPGEVIEVAAAPGQTYVLNFDPAIVEIRVVGNDLVLIFPDGGQIVLLGLGGIGPGDSPPIFEIAGEAIPGDALFAQAVALTTPGEAAPGTVPTLETAAGQAAAVGTGATRYSDDHGQVIDLLDPQGVIPPVFLEFRLIDLEVVEVILDQEAPNTPPVADPVVTPADTPDEEGENIPPDLLAALQKLGLGGGGGASGVIDSRSELDTLLGAGAVLEDFETFIISNGNAVLLDFNSLDSSTTTNGQGPGLVVDDVTFATSGSGQIDILQWNGQDYFGQLSKNILSGFEGLLVDFDGSIDAFGVDLTVFSGFADVVDITVFASDDSTVLATFSGISILDPSDPAFFGYTDDTGIGSVLLEGNNFGFSPLIDNLAFGDVTGSGGDANIAFFKEFTVDGVIDGNNIEGDLATLGGLDAETPLSELTFTLNSQPTFGFLILVTADGATTIMSDGDTFTSADTIWWVATDSDVAAVLEANDGILPDVTFDYSVTDPDGNTASAPVLITIDDLPTASDDNPETDPEGTVVDEALGDQDGNGSNFDEVKVSGNVLANDDFGGDGPGAPQITDVDYDGTLGAAVKDTSVAGQITFTASNWTLVIITDGPAAGDYVFTQTAPFDHPAIQGTNSVDGVFTYTIQDSDGDPADADLTIRIIDDIPEAFDDTDTVDEGGTTDGNVITGLGTNEGLDGLGSDTEGADGAVLTAVSFNGTPISTSGSLTDLGGLVIETANGTLTIFEDGDYSYTAKSDIDAGSDVFTYTLTDGDDDFDPATLTIAIEDSTPLVDPETNTVDEAGLDLFADGDDLAAGDTTGSDSSNTTETVTGTLSFSDPDGAVITEVSGETAVSGVITVTTSLGVLAVFTTDAAAIAAGFTQAGDYVYTLTTNSLDHTSQGTAIDGVTDSFTYEVTDSLGNTNTSTITISVIDDVPTARPDTDTVDEGGTTDGNVISGLGTNEGLDGVGSDTEGADGAVLTAVSFTGTPISVSGSLTDVGGLVIETANGTLTIFEDGDYSYTAKSNIDAGSDVFTYTLTDGDDDFDPATLTIAIEDSTPVVDPETNTVDEAGLDLFADGDDLAAGDRTGTDSPNTTETVTGTLSFSDPDGAVITEVSGETAVSGVITVTTSLGVLAVFTTDAAAIAAGFTQAGDYVYTLTTNSLDHTSQGTAIDGVTDSFTYEVTDSLGNTNTSTITISVIDDVPAVDATTDLIYANSSNGDGGGTGVFEYSIGADERSSFSASDSDFSAITLTGMVGDTGITDATVDWDSENATTAVFLISFMYAANPLTPEILTAATGKLTFNKAAGTYTVELDEPIESFTVLTTSATVSKESFNIVGEAESQPEIVVSKLADDFFVRFSGQGEEGGNPGVDLHTDSGDLAFTEGELFEGVQTWVSISGTENGVASDTLQGGEVLDMEFYTASPEGDITPPQGDALASGLFLKLGKLGVGEDLVVVLKLVDADNPLLTTTKVIVVDYGDIWLDSETNPYGITFDDVNSGVVIIESNDYNFGADNWLIYGAQLLVSSEGVTGTAIDLNRETGETGGSTLTDALDAATDDNDVIKVIDIGIITAETTTEDANLTFEFEVIDGDGDTTSTQTLDVTIEGDTVFTGSDEAESIQGSSGDDTLIGGGGADILTGGLGADVFVYAAGDAEASVDLADLITDFDNGTDLIGLIGGLTDGQLTIDQSADVTGDAVNDTVISVTAGGAILTVLDGITTTIDGDDFTIIV